MAYPESMTASIRKLEATRSQRMQQKLPLLSLEEKNRLLTEFHPDFRPGAHREIRVGINRGERAVSELVDLLEADGLVAPDAIDLNDASLAVDVLILGAGGAGLTAALFCHDAGAKVALATKLRPGDSNTIMAEGGINAAVSPLGMQGMWLDTPLIDMLHGPGTVLRYYRHLYNRFKKYGIDFAQEPVLIYPAEHYQNGGVITDDMGRSNLPNLYVIGEAAGGVHGRNRLGGNSLSDIFVFGRRAGILAGERFKDIRLGRPTLAHLAAYRAELKTEGIDTSRKSPLVLPEYRFEKALPVFQQ